MTAIRNLDITIVNPNFKFLQMNEFDAKAIAAALRDQSRARLKPRTYQQRRSVLDSRTFEILALDREGCTVGEIQRWLESSKGIQVHRTTVQRWLQANRIPSL